MLEFGSDLVYDSHNVNAKKGEDKEEEENNVFSPSEVMQSRIKPTFLTMSNRKSDGGPEACMLGIFLIMTPCVTLPSIQFPLFKKR